jgi:hypothetical protein
MAINIGTFIVKNTTPSIESKEAVTLPNVASNINVGNFIVKNKPIVTETLSEVEVASTSSCTDGRRHCRS